MQLFGNAAGDGQEVATDDGMLTCRRGKGQGSWPSLAAVLAVTPSRSSPRASMGHSQHAGTRPPRQNERTRLQNLQSRSWLCPVVLLRLFLHCSIISC
jgi:hypothetical protein